MTEERRPRVCAQLLGMTWLGIAPQLPFAGYGVEAVGPDVYRVTYWPSTSVYDDHNRTTWTIDLPTLEVAALLRHAGSLDVGPCEECETRSTGRETVEAWRAVLMGARVDGGSHGAIRMRVTRMRVTVTSRGHEGAREALAQLAEQLEACAAEAMRDGRAAADLGLWRGVPRADLLAFDGPEHDRWLHPCPDLGAWVLAWLAGECQAKCQFSRRLRDDGRVELVASKCSTCAKTGLAIGHLDAIEAHLTASWERETVECGECRGKGWSSLVNTGFTFEGFRVIRHDPDPRGRLHWRETILECRTCAGLGRVRPRDARNAP